MAFGNDSGVSAPGEANAGPLRAFLVLSLEHVGEPVERFEVDR